MRIRFLSRLLEMAYGKAQLVAWVQGQIDNIVQNYILLHIAKHAPVYDTMPRAIGHWERELRTAMGAIVGKKASCSKDAVVRGVLHLFNNIEELSSDPEVIADKTWNRMADEKVSQESDAYKEAAAAFMREVPRIAEIVGRAKPAEIAAYISKI